MSLPACNYRNSRVHLICFENITGFDSMAHITPAPLRPFGYGVDATTMFVCPDSPVRQTACGWCDKSLVSKAFTFRAAAAESDDEKAFCTEQCFSQYRRANFKRNKTCDWCRHLRHTVVNCVDFQDGDHQLQFCRRVEHRNRAKRVTQTHTPTQQLLDRQPFFACGYNSSLYSFRDGSRMYRERGDFNGRMMPLLVINRKKYSTLTFYG